YILPTLLASAMAACTGSRKTEEKPIPIYPKPPTVALNTNGGYRVNPVSGDTIPPIVLESGDTLLTGIPLLARGKDLHPDSVETPKVVPYTPSGNTYKVQHNLHYIPDNLTVVPVKEEALTTIHLEKIAESDTLHYLVNSSGDTLKTGVAIPSSGKIQPFIQTQPTLALPPRFKDAANTNLQYLDVDQGLSNSYVLAALEDRRGNLWFGTLGGGVCRYDGENFTHITEKEGLSNNVVNSILEDQNSNLWFGTRGGGVIRYDGEHFVHFTEKEGLSNNTVRCILEDQHGNLWFGTTGGGVNRYDGKSLTCFSDKEGLGNNSVWSMLEDSSGNLWFGTQGGGVSRFDGKSFTNFTKKEGLSHNFVRTIVEDQHGHLWFGTLGGGLNRYDGESFTHFTQNEGLSDDNVWSSLRDKSGHLWFGTRGGGVNRYDGKSFRHFTQNEGLSMNTVTSIVEDGSGNLWFGTLGGGVNRYDSRSFVHFTEKEGFSKNSVWSILEDNNSHLWFGTHGGGVIHYDGNYFTHITQKEGLSDNRVWCILEDKSGQLWFGTRGGGVNRYDGTSFTHFTEKEGLSNNSVLSILEDQNGHLWFGTFGGGVSRYDGERFTHFTEKEGLSSNIVTSIVEDQSGHLWFGTPGSGISRFDGKYFTHFTAKEGLFHNVVNSMVEDPSGNLWIGALGGGVSRFDGEGFTHFTDKEGLSHNTVWSMMVDRDESLWISTESGLNNLIPNLEGISGKNRPSNDVKIALRTYEKNDGLKGMDFHFNSVHLDRRNRLWWGSGKSLTMLDMNQHQVHLSAPVVHLKQVHINEQFIDYRNLGDSLVHEMAFKGWQRFENYPLHLKLPYDKNHLTFHFTAIDWKAPHKIQYSYLMEGLNNTWSQPTTETKADYRNLPHGTYTFKVRAIGASNEWSESFDYSFTIHPPWWHTWWARTGFGFAALLVLVGSIQWRTAALKQRQKELETEVAIATREIREQKEEIEKAKERSEELLLNILPGEVAEELKEKGHSDAQLIDEVTVLFTDFRGFIAISEQVTPKQLVQDLHECFSAFDNICEKYGIEKIKTIGDAYMAAGGIPSPNKNHAQDVVNAALEMVNVMEQIKIERTANDRPFFEIRIGVHTGPVVAGIVGVKKFQYDIWGDTVNTASRMESSSAVGQVNISQVTYSLLKNDAQFAFENRGKVKAKGKGEIEMYFVAKT
ncbi:MAG: two-component regulator propeller domain-containing protein, partial [Salibacteraceae bacterium]